MIYNVKIGNHNRDYVINYILNKKAEGHYTVIDVGGSANGWSFPYINALVDFNDCNYNNSHITFFKCDITHPDSWIDLLKYVEKNGKFNFCICTHTLEDIINPAFVCEQISKISNEGYIAVPSKFKELSRFESSYNYRGYIHHRWIFNIENNIFMGYPKINYIETDNKFDSIADNSEDKKDLSFFWKDKIDIKYINNNYLGPNLDSVLSYYNSLCKNEY